MAKKKQRHFDRLPEEGLLRVSEFIDFLPVGKSTWYAGVKAGRFPQPVKLGTKTVCWRAQDLRQLLTDGVPV